MKIETKETEWKPIVVTIESRREAQELYDHIANSAFPVESIAVLWDILGDRLA